jgi:RecA-family ATPase
MASQVTKGHYMTSILTIGELLNMEFPEQKWVVDKLVPAAALTLYTGTQGSYKSWSLLHMALSIAEGKPVFGHFKTEKSGILIVDNEDKLWQLQDRLNKLGASSNISVYFSKDRDFNINDNEMVEDLLRECETKKIKVMVMDSLRRIHSGEENSSKEMSAVFRQIDKFIDKGIAVIVTQHLRKEGGNSSSISQAVRGSSDIMAAPDSHLSLKRKGRQLTFHQTKQRFAEEISPFQVEIRGEEDENYSGRPKPYNPVRPLFSV